MMIRDAEHQPVPAARPRTLNARACIADRLHTLGHPMDLLTDGAIEELAHHTTDSIARLRAAMASALFLASTENASRIERDHIVRALDALPVARTEARPADRRRAKRRPYGPVIATASVAAACAVAAIMVPLSAPSPQHSPATNATAVPGSAGMGRGTPDATRVTSPDTISRMASLGTQTGPQKASRPSPAPTTAYRADKAVSHQAPEHPAAIPHSPAIQPAPALQRAGGTAQPGAVTPSKLSAAPSASQAAPVKTPDIVAARERATVATASPQSAAPPSVASTQDTDVEPLQQVATTSVVLRFNPGETGAAAKLRSLTVQLHRAGFSRVVAAPLRGHFAGPVIGYYFGQDRPAALAVVAAIGAASPFHAGQHSADRGVRLLARADAGWPRPPGTIEAIIP